MTHIEKYLKYKNKYLKCKNEYIYINLIGGKSSLLGLQTSLFEGKSSILQSGHFFNEQDRLPSGIHEAYPDQMSNQVNDIQKLVIKKINKIIKNNNNYIQIYENESRKISRNTSNDNLVSRNTNEDSSISRNISILDYLPSSIKNMILDYIPESLKEKSIIDIIKNNISCEIQCHIITGLFLTIILTTNIEGIYNYYNLNKEVIMYILEKLNTIESIKNIKLINNLINLFNKINKIKDLVKSSDNIDKKLKKITGFISNNLQKNIKEDTKHYYNKLYNKIMKQFNFCG